MTTTPKNGGAAPAPPPGFDFDDDPVIVGIPITSPKASAMKGLAAPPGFFDDEVLAKAEAKEKAPPPPLPPRKVVQIEGMANAQQREDLKAFLKWKEPTLPEDRADMLLNMYLLEDVADGIRAKYGMLPPGWRNLVKNDLIGRDLPKGLNRDFNVEVGKDKKVATEGIAISDRKIDEILDTEARFVAVITELQNKYLDELYRIYGRTGTKADREVIKALGITQEECNQIFDQLPAIVRFSQALLSKLEIVSLVRKQPITGEGRAIHIGRAFVAMAPKLHVYAPAITSYNSSLAILNEAIARLKPHKDYKNFVEIWNEMVQTNEVLRQQQLQAVLIQPMQRVPRYKMLLEQLLKDCDNPEAVPVVQEALGLFSSAAKNINEAMRKHEKLAGFFGAGAELKAISSSGSTKDGEVKIKQEYHSKLL
jgi:hypothetical protein